MKKIKLMVPMCLILASSVLSSCGKNNNPLANAQNLYGFGAVSSVKLLGNSISTSSLKHLLSLAQNSSRTTSDEVKDQIDRFNSYFSAFDSFLGEDIISTNVSNNSNQNYPYENIMTIKGKDFEGKNTEYTLYYTEVLTKSEVEDDEAENEYSLTGIMLLDNKEYYIEGERTSETESDEAENELSITAYLDKNDKSNRIVMEQEHSIEANESEIEYVYSVYSNNILVEQTAIEFENEKKNGKEEIEYSISFRQGETKGSYEIEKETTSAKTEMKVTYYIDNKKGEFRIEASGDKYTYTFEDGSKITI